MGRAGQAEARQRFSIETYGERLRAALRIDED
jgi:hypothetical protein